jgi:four helix bundle protein
MQEGDKHIIWERRQTELWDRIFQVTQDVVTLADGFTDNTGGRVLKEEMVKSAMAVGSNLVRATASDEGNNFYGHLNEAKMKAVETDYWLRLAYVLNQRDEVQKDLSSVISQYSAVIDLLAKMMRHVHDEKGAVVKHHRGPKVNL